MRSGFLGRLSALLLGSAGLTLLFASDLILPRLLADFPLDGYWFGQLLGAAWIGFAALTWQSRGQLLGGIYGRPIVFASFVHWFVAASVLFSAARRSDVSTTLTMLAIVATLLAAGYGALLLKGPFPHDLRAHGML